jgi:hypothetical protein
MRVHCEQTVMMPCEACEEDSASLCRYTGTLSANSQVAMTLCRGCSGV